MNFPNKPMAAWPASLPSSWSSSLPSSLSLSYDTEHMTIRRHGGVSCVDALSGTTGQQSEKLADAQHNIKNNTDEQEEHNGPTQPDPDKISFGLPLGRRHVWALASGEWSTQCTNSGSTFFRKAPPMKAQKFATRKEVSSRDVQKFARGRGLARSQSDF